LLQLEGVIKSVHALIAFYELSKGYDHRRISDNVAFTLPHSVGGVCHVQWVRRETLNIAVRKLDDSRELRTFRWVIRYLCLNLDGKGCFLLNKQVAGGSNGDTWVIG
jgi:hypothetical protein